MDLDGTWTPLLLSEPLLLERTLWRLIRSTRENDTDSFMFSFMNIEVLNAKIPSGSTHTATGHDQTLEWAPPALLATQYGRPDVSGFRKSMSTNVQIKVEPLTLSRWSPGWTKRHLTIHTLQLLVLDSRQSSILVSSLLVSPPVFLQSNWLLPLTRETRQCKTWAGVCDSWPPHWNHCFNLSFKFREGNQIIDDHISNSPDEV